MHTQIKSEGGEIIYIITNQSQKQKQINNNNKQDIYSRNNIAFTKNKLSEGDLT